VRWAPTFRDTAIPVVLGIGEIVPAYLLDRPVAWWFAFATFALLGCGAFGNTVLRLREDYFPRHRDSYRAVRTLLLRLMHLCMTAVGTSVVVALLIRALPRTATLIAVVAAGGLILIIAAAMVGYSEYVLNDAYRKFGIGRRPPLFNAGTPPSVRAPPILLPDKERSQHHPAPDDLRTPIDAHSLA
jgi:hypothetical protein